MSADRFYYMKEPPQFNTENLLLTARIIEIGQSQTTGIVAIEQSDDRL